MAVKYLHCEYNDIRLFIKPLYIYSVSFKHWMHMERSIIMIVVDFRFMLFFRIYLCEIFRMLKV